MATMNIVVLCLWFSILGASDQDAGFIPSPVLEKQCGSRKCEAGEKCIDIVSRQCEEASCARHPTCVPVQARECDSRTCPHGELCLNVALECQDGEACFSNGMCRDGSVCVIRTKCVLKTSVEYSSCGQEVCRTGEACYRVATSDCTDSNCLKYPVCLSPKELPCNNVNCGENSECVNIRTECPYTACDMYARCVPKADNSNFPRPWYGIWFQAGIQDPIIIQNNTLSLRGTLVRRHGFKFLLKDSQLNCYRCLKINERHENVLQYQESFCEQSESLGELCDSIAPDSIRYSLLRNHNVKPISCPMHGEFVMRYQRGRGWCEAPPSSVHTCTSDTRMLFHFYACPDVRSSESSVEELQCLATWTEGSTKYLVGKFKNNFAWTVEHRFHCFVYERVNNVTYNLAQSEDATCNHLRSATEGARTMTLYEVTDSPAECSFPSWLMNNMPLHPVNHTDIWHVKEYNSSIDVRSEGGVRVRLDCHANVDSTESTAKMIVRRTEGCKTKYVCMLFSKIDNVLTVGTWRSSEFSDQACTASYFNVTQLRYTTLTSACSEGNGSMLTNETFPFDRCSPVNITVQRGNAAHLPCKIIHQGNLTVTWIRNRGRRLLSVGRMLITGNRRIEISYQPHSSTWTLLINAVRFSDTGVYSCQFSSPNGMFTRNVQLNVVERRPKCGVNYCEGNEMCKSGFECVAAECKPFQLCLPADVATCDGVQCNPGASCVMISTSSCVAPHCYPVPQCLIRLCGHSFGADDSETQFDPCTPVNITVKVGSTVHIPCRVLRLGNRTVSWIRTRDYHVLTVGSFSYTADERFQSVHESNSSTWNLQINYVQTRDAGTYGCQVSTTPIITKYVELHVVENEEKEGVCPRVSFSRRSSCRTTCSSDVDCIDRLKCCSNGCAYVCTEPVLPTRPGYDNGEQCGDVLCTTGEQCEPTYQCLQSHCRSYNACLSNNADENWKECGHETCNPDVPCERIHECLQSKCSTHKTCVPQKHNVTAERCGYETCNEEEQCLQVYDCVEYNCSSSATCLPRNIDTCANASCEKCKMVQLKQCITAPCYAEPYCNQGVPEVHINLGFSINYNTIQEGDDVYFECATNSSVLPVQISWTHNGNLLRLNVSQGIIMSNQSLVLQRLDRRQAGVYRCQAENNAGVGYSQPLTLNILYRPQVQIRLGENINAEHIQAGEDIYFECLVLANPPARTIAWFFEAQRLYHDPLNGILIANHSLVLQSVTREQAGEYQCDATNQIGRRHSEPFSLQIQ